MSGAGIQPTMGVPAGVRPQAPLIQVSWKSSGPAGYTRSSGRGWGQRAAMAWIAGSESRASPLSSKPDHPERLSWGGSPARSRAKATTSTAWSWARSRASPWSCQSRGATPRSTAKVLRQAARTATRSEVPAGGNYMPTCMLEFSLSSASVASTSAAMRMAIPSTPESS